MLKTREINTLVIPCIATYSACYKSKRQMIPRGIVLHSTGANNPYLRRYVDNEALFGKNANENFFGTEASGDVIPHIVIGLDAERRVKAAQLLPFNMCCWGCGRGSKGSYNYNPAYIQIEMCEDNLTNPVYFRQVIDLAGDICAALCETYNIETPNIVSHKEAHLQGYASNHGDPENWFDWQSYSMDKFRKEVKSKRDTKEIYRVQVGAFSVYEYAVDYLDKLKDMGIPCFIVKEEI